MNLYYNTSYKIRKFMGTSSAESGLERTLSVPGQKTTEKPSLLRRVLGEVTTSADKGLKFFMSGTAMGAFDAAGGGNSPIFNQIGDALNRYASPVLRNAIPLFGSNFYEGFLMLFAGALSSWSLYDRRWRKRRNLLNLMGAPANAVVTDYSSAAISKQNLNAFPLSPTDYTWRYTAYDNTWWGHFVNTVNSPSHLIPGAIQGYDFAIYIFLGYLAIQGAIVGRHYLRDKAMALAAAKETAQTT
jgi:hypothetical protein